MASSYYVTYGTDRLTFGGSGSVAWEAPDELTLLDYMPVGTVYKTTAASFDPNTAFGGVWSMSAFSGRTPIGYSAGLPLSGGETSHTLTMAECPSHNHTFQRVLYATWGQDKQTQNWNVYNGNNGSFDKIANGYMVAHYPTNKATHPNVQLSKIVKIWERVG